MILFENHICILWLTFLLYHDLFIWVCGDFLLYHGRELAISPFPVKYHSKFDFSSLWDINISLQLITSQWKLPSLVTHVCYLAILVQLCQYKELVKREVSLKDDAIKQKSAIQQLLHLKSQVLINLFFYKQNCFSMLDVNWSFETCELHKLNWIMRQLCVGAWQVQLGVLEVAW